MQNVPLLRTLGIALGILLAAGLVLFAILRLSGGNPRSSAEPSQAVQGAAVSWPPTTGEDTYNQACALCHAMGIAGAPKVGDVTLWAPRIAKGKDVLYRNSIEGFLGDTGMMPAKGGRVDLPEEMVRAAVDYMVDRAQ